MARSRTPPEKDEPKSERRLLQSRVSENTYQALQVRLKRLDISAAAYLKRLIMVDLGLLGAEDR